MSIARTSIRAALVLMLASVVALPLAAAPDAHAKSHARHAGKAHTRKGASKSHHKKGGLYWGAWIGSQLTGVEAPWDMGAVANMEGRLGKGLSLVEFSAPFTSCEPTCRPQEFPRVGMEAIRLHGSIPILSWGSQATTSGHEDPEFALARIASGALDPYLTWFAQAAQSWGHPFFLRFNWEMNGGWFLWSAHGNGNTAKAYVAAWRHVHDVFASVGATNATWVWCPYANGKRGTKALKALYPGNAYVDWTCLDGYNWGYHSINPSPWRSFSFLFEPSYRQIVKKIAPRKPMMIGEMASNGGGKPKARWIHNMFNVLPRRFPKIRALVWFDHPDRGMSWPLETSPAAVKAFARGVHNARFRANAFGGLTKGPIEPPR